MSDYNGRYVKTKHDHVFWSVDDGKRERVEDQNDLYNRGLRPVVVITQEQLNDIPVKGAIKRKKA